MNINIDEIINEDLTLEELGEIVKEAMSKMYCKLQSDMNMQDPSGLIVSLGSKSYDVNIKFIDTSVCSKGEEYEWTYNI